MRPLSVLTSGACALLLLGCVAPGKYKWGNYESSLYASYKDPAQQAAYLAELERVTSLDKSQGKIVAPGLHAEYGYLLLQAGKHADAIRQFQAEKQKWPESTQLMDKLIQLASKAPTAPSTAQGEK